MNALAYREDGPDGAPVLVLASSLGTTREMWQPQLAALAGQWRLVRFDHPGHGESPIWQGKVTVADIGRAVLALLDGLGYERFSFCGLSLGGAVGQWLGAHVSERIERLVLCCTAAEYPSAVYRERARVVRVEGVGTVATAVVERWFTPEFRARQPAIVNKYRSMLAATVPEGYAACCEAVASFDGREDLAAISAPTLVIAGAEDPTTPEEQRRVLVEGIRGARLEVVPRAAHLANVEQPAAVDAAILIHLRGSDDVGQR